MRTSQRPAREYRSGLLLSHEEREAASEGRVAGVEQDKIPCSGLASGLSLCPVSLEAMKSKSLFRQLIECLFPKREEIGQDLIDSGTENTFQIAL